MGSKIFSVEVRYRQCLHVSLAGKVKTGPLTRAGFLFVFNRSILAGTVRDCPDRLFSMCNNKEAI